MGIDEGHPDPLPDELENHAFQEPRLAGAGGADDVFVSGDLGAVERQLHWPERETVFNGPQGELCHGYTLSRSGVPLVLNGSNHIGEKKTSVGSDARVSQLEKRKRSA